MNIPSNPTGSGHTVTGKVSWFGGPKDSMDSGHTASGGTTAEPGIATYNRATLGGYWRVTAANGRTAILKQTDLGPAPFTGRAIDVTYSALGKLGYNESNFPTDSTFHATYLGKNPPAGGAAQAQPAQAKPATAIPGTPATSTTALDPAAFQAAQAKVATNQFVAKALGGGTNNILPGTMNLSTPQASEFMKTTTIPGAPAVPAEKAAAIPGAPSGSSGYVHPIPGFTIGRTDMGVDASAKPGTPIRAIGDSKVLEIQKNWYAGQPYVSLELTSGPRKGQVYYVAEQIAPAVKVGDQVGAGATIGHYASSGTGIEIGFGVPGGRTKAQATGNTGDSSHGNSPAGIEFAKFLKGLK